MFIITLFSAPLLPALLSFLLRYPAIRGIKVVKCQSLAHLEQCSVEARAGIDPVDIWVEKSPKALDRGIAP